MIQIKQLSRQFGWKCRSTKTYNSLPNWYFKMTSEKISIVNSISLNALRFFQSRFKSTLMEKRRSAAVFRVAPNPLQKAARIHQKDIDLKISSEFYVSAHKNEIKLAELLLQDTTGGEEGNPIRCQNGKDCVAHEPKRRYIQTTFGRINNRILFPLRRLQRQNFR